MSEHLLSTEQVCEAYAALRVRVTEMMQSLSLEQFENRCPPLPTVDREGLFGPHGWRSRRRD